MHLLLSKNREKYKDVKLMLLGSVRNAGDEAIVNSLRQKAKDLNIMDNVVFLTNATYEKVITMLSISACGIHTMWNEHFGISIVEMMAAGLVVVAHNSGGPASDIVTPFNDMPTGNLLLVIYVIMMCS
jgi:alpha-1,2-mannosyltransferase